MSRNDTTSSKIGVEEIGERIAELYRLIARLKIPGETRRNKWTGAISPYHPLTDEWRQIEEWELELQNLTRRQSEKLQMRSEFGQKKKRPRSGQ